VGTGRYLQMHARKYVRKDKDALVPAQLRCTAPPVSSTRAATSAPAATSAQAATSAPAASAGRERTGGGERWGGFRRVIGGVVKTNKELMHLPDTRRFHHPNRWKAEHKTDGIRCPKYLFT
jgi:hypothetical protein